MPILSFMYWDSVNSDAAVMYFLLVKPPPTTIMKEVPLEACLFISFTKLFIKRMSSSPFSFVSVLPPSEIATLLVHSPRSMVSPTLGAYASNPSPLRLSAKASVFSGLPCTHTTTFGALSLTNL